LIILFLVFALIAEKEKRKETGDLPKAREAKQEIKAENKQKILNLLNSQTAITNNNVQSLLGVSDATATRYLENMEAEGLITQKQKTGRGVTYEKIGRSR